MTTYVDRLKSSEVVQHEDTKARAARFSKTTPFVYILRDGRQLLARVVWAKFDRVRVARWIGTERCIYATPETVSWARIVKEADSQVEPPICGQLNIAP